MINKTILVGNVGADPAKHDFDNGFVVNFSLATTERWRDKDGEKQSLTTWHNVKAFGRIAENIMAYVKKGDLLYVEGKIKNRTYEKDGVKRYATDIVCSFMQMLGNKNEEPIQNDTEFS